MKTLYFEGAGCVPRGTVENCRIRTAFTNDCGEKIYLELMGVEITKHNKTAYPDYEKLGYVGIVDCCVAVGDRDYKQIKVKRNMTFPYTHKGILDLINPHMRCSFDGVRVADDLSGYRVHADGSGHNFGDEFTPDLEREKEYHAIKKRYYQIEREEGKQYPNFSIWVDPIDFDKLHILRHFNSYNRHRIYDYHAKQYTEI
jgi:hypothetical protein